MLLNNKINKLTVVIMVFFIVSLLYTFIIFRHLLFLVVKQKLVIFNKPSHHKKIVKKINAFFNKMHYNIFLQILVKKI